jgi:hypothetical protein
MVETQYPIGSLAEKLEGDATTARAMLEYCDAEYYQGLAASAHLLESQLALKIQQLEKETENANFWYDKFIEVSKVYTDFVDGMTSVITGGK